MDVLPSMVLLDMKKRLLREENGLLNRLAVKWFGCSETPPPGPRGCRLWEATMVAHMAFISHRFC